MDFCHLHLHTDGSFLDSGITIKKLIKRVTELGSMESVGISDHGSLTNAFKFVREAKDKEVKPIVGIEAYMVGDVTKLRDVGEKQERYHLTLIAMNETGWRNLLRMHTMAHRDYFYHKPCIDYKILNEHSDGIIALSGCMNCHIIQSLFENNEDEAIRVAILMKQIFGDRFYFELQRINLPAADSVIPALQAMAQSLGQKVVATNDVHFLKKDHHTIHEMLTCVCMGKQFGSDKLTYPDGLYLKSAEEMSLLFKDIPDAVSNTMEIVERCNLDFEEGRKYYPVYQPPQDELQAFKNTNPKMGQYCKSDQDYYLYLLARNGYGKRVPKNKQGLPIYYDRLAYELKMIFDMGYSSYFLVVWDFINWCREKNIPVGPARGSSAGSLVCYCIGITQPDPISAELIFERFLNPGRKKSPPDIDTDFSAERRDEVIQYVFDKYGADRCSLIGTFGTIKVKTAIRDACRVLGISIAETNEMAKSVPELPTAKLDFKASLEMSPKLKSYYDKRTTDRKLDLVFKYVEEFEGAMHHSGKHAAGVVIGPGGGIEFDDIIPMFYDRDNKRLFTAVDMNDVENAGLLKMDFLGLENLDQIAETLKMVGYNGTYYDFMDFITNNNLEDQNIINAVFRNQNSLGVFQFEFEGMIGYMKQLGITEFEDLVVLTSAARPGAKDFIPYMAECKSQIRDPEYDDRRLEPILRRTWGVILYQEQAIQLFKDMAGFSLAEADLARRAIGKKKKAELDAFKTKFIEGSVKNGYAKHTAEAVFEKIALHSGYSFNRSHAYAYSIISWMCAYLKTYHPVEFLAVNMTYKDKSMLKKYIEEANRLGIIVLPPCVRHSKARFSVEVLDIESHRGHAYFDQLYGRLDKAHDGHKVIRFGTGKINGVPEEYDFSAHAPYTDVFEFVKKNPTINRKALEQLILAGALDCFGIRREVLLENSNNLLQSSRQNKTHEAQTTLFEEDFEDEEPETNLKQPEKYWDLKTLFVKESDVSGNCFIVSFDEAFGKEIKEYASGMMIKDFLYLPKGQNCIFVGIIYTKKFHKSRKAEGKQMMFMTIGDYESQAELAVFDDSLRISAERMNDQVSENLFEEGDIVVVHAVSQGTGSFVASYLKKI